MDVREEIRGSLFAGAAFSLWGVLPLYWKLLSRISAAEILSHRIIWSFIFTTGFLFLYGKKKNLYTLFRDQAKMKYIALGAFFVSVNWLVYIWAVNNNRIVEASLGYYINPLISFLIGVMLLGETTDKVKTSAILLALVGVALIAAGRGRPPWVSLTLAFSFALYGLMKKKARADALPALALETALAAPFALVYILLTAGPGAAVGNATLSIHFLLFFSGIVTAFPLFLFALAANRISLSTIAFLQYLTPTINLALATLLYKEPFTDLHMASFTLIWAGILLFSFSRWRDYRKLRPRGLAGAGKGEDI
ncbi:MAG TPA: EamA family transporter RarD [Candidatus Mcinerneyibacteriales bacterium]|nr:EamA family transporter RarD [Candidatus Mcinerneyibacteriales bacterium]HPE19987.1 EamA family transporter RarD [Candidatus Mcinerneyibacteriales bacterium]HPJ69942.1 EamA family transporter RarD [Candidatus Mcinerneyibacteriales bacterium]HPQ88592.1 EamA family transporter RarD [Candidatus Mcinerneyibacteriales bacterium]